MDIFESGYGKLDIHNDDLCVRLVFEEKKLKKKLFHQIKLVVIEYHLKRKTHQINFTSSHQPIFEISLSTKRQWAKQMQNKPHIIEFGFWFGWFLSNSYTVWILSAEE